MAPERSYQHTVFLVSDGTGDTGGRLVQAALHQFEPGLQTGVRKFSLIRTREQIDRCMKLATKQRAVVVYTLAAEDLRGYLEAQCLEAKLLHLDIMSPLFKLFSQLFGVEPKRTSGVLHAVDQRYFKRIEAIEYTLGHDDGQGLQDLSQADIVLLGISRTSKTPTSVYLAQEGLKVVNVPLVINIPPPEEALAKLEQRRIVGLTINPFRLAEIRKIRMKRMNSWEGNYADPQAISLEVAYAESFFRRHRSWTVVDVTDKAIEETADMVLNAVFGRQRSISR